MVRSRQLLPLLSLLLSLLLPALLPALLTAQGSPYAGLESRSIKALSPEQIDQYRSGAGLGFAMAAELNGYPGPKHVLELATELKLTPDQKSRVQRSFDSMHERAVRLGDQFVDLERRLDSLFVTRSVTPGSMDELLGALGDTWSQLRGTHLRAHLETLAILTDHQVKRYSVLRGYQGSGEHKMNQQHH